MCLSDLFSVCTVEFAKKYKKDELCFLNEKIVESKELKRIILVLDRVREIADSNLRGKIGYIQ